MLANPSSPAKEPQVTASSPTSMKEPNHHSMNSMKNQSSSVIGSYSNGSRVRQSTNQTQLQASAFISQQQQNNQLPEMALMSQAQQRHQMDQEFAAAATGLATPVALELTNRSHVNSGGKLPAAANGNGPQQKRSTLEEAGGIQMMHHQEGAGSKFRLQSLATSLNSQGAQNNNSNYPVQSNTMGIGGLFSTTLAEQQQVQYSRSFKGTGNQIAAMNGQPFKGSKAAGTNVAQIGQSTLSQLTQQQAQTQQQPSQWINRITRTNTTTMAASTTSQQQVANHQYTHDQLNSQQVNGTSQLGHSNRMQHQIGSAQSITNEKQNGITSHLAYRQQKQQRENTTDSNGVMSSAGRKTRIKSNRKRRFSTSSIHGPQDDQNTDQHGQVVSAKQTRKLKLQNQQTAAQIIQMTPGQQDSNAVTYSSVGELKIQQHQQQSGVSGQAYHSNMSGTAEIGVIDRFNNSRAQKKALNSMQPIATSNKEQLYTNLQHIVDLSQTALKQPPGGKADVSNFPQAHAAAVSQNQNKLHYGTTHQSYSNGAGGGPVKKQYSHSVTRRNNNQNVGLQETASGNQLEAGSGQDQSQRSNTGGGNGVQNGKNHNSLRNSKSLNKKLSHTGAKKAKKLKKSESQVRHQQLPKSEMRAPENETGQIELASQGNKTSFPSGLNSMNGTNSALHRPQQDSHVSKRVTNRTPQSFTVNEKVTGVNNAANNKANTKYTDVVKGSTTYNNAVSNQAQNFGKNLTDLHKNAMHIKKLNFAGGRQMQNHATQPVIANNHYTAGGPPIQQEGTLQENNNLRKPANGFEPLQQLHQAVQNSLLNSKDGIQQNLNSSASKTAHNVNSDRQHFFTQNQATTSSNNNNQAASSTIESLLRNAAGGQNSFQDFKNAFTSKTQQMAAQTSNGAAQVTQKTYKIMKSAERGETNTNTSQFTSTVGCRQHQDNGNGTVQTSSPCTCQRQQANGGGSFQSKASQNFQKSFRHGNFVYHGGHRRSNDFSTIQAKQTSSAQSPFAGMPNSTQTPQFNQAPTNPAAPPQQATPHITQSKREDVNKFGGNFAGSTAQKPDQQNQAGMNPLMKDLLQYLQQAYQTQNVNQSTQDSVGGAASGPVNPTHHQILPQQAKPSQPISGAPIQGQTPVDQLKQRLAQAQMRQAAHVAATSTTEATNSAAAAAQAHPFGSSAAAAEQKNKLIHFEKGDRIIYEPNEMHQLKYINDKGDVSPITGVQYILTQPNFSKGRPCHFFVVNKQEFEAATKGFKLKQEEQKVEDLPKKRKLQAVANIRSHRASQKIRTQATGKTKKIAQERKQSAKGGRDASAAAAKNETAIKEAKAKEEEKKDEKDKYHNQAYNYQKLRSLKWMGGPYRNPHDDQGPIWRPSAEEQELRQQLEAKREIKAKYNLLSLAKTAGTELYKYILMLGNNCEVVKRVMDSRPSWTKITSSQTLYNFKWAPSSRQIKFDFLGKHGQKNLVNHFENHALITTKDQLIESMSKLCENLHQDIFNAVPITFVIDLGTPMCQHEFEKFNYYFNMIEKFRDQYVEASDENSKQDVLGQMNKNIQQHYQLSEKKRKYTTVTMRPTLFDGHNMWLFKPADANRGRGVNLFNTIDQLKRLILEHTSRAETKQFQNFAQTNNLHGPGGAPLLPEEATMALATEQQTMTAAAATSQSQAQQAQQQPPTAAPVINTANIKADVFVLQKYIEKPLLISQRKFDIRLWVMVTPEHKCYYFKEGYIRMSGQNYDLTQVDNLMIHLTNNAIQKQGTNYGEFEEGNILSFKEGAEFLKKQDGIDVDFYQLLREEMLPIIETTMMSIRQKINKNNRKFCMEIFGYDFMVDNEMRPWLIEVNTNPCLEESNKLLRDLIPRMLDDGFKLTLDVMFPPKTAVQIAEAQALMEDGEQPTSTGSQTFSVPGCPDSENLWGDQPFYILRVPGATVVQGS